MIIRSNDDKYLASCSVDCTIKIFNLQKKIQEECFEIRPNCKLFPIDFMWISYPDAVKSMVITPDNKYIITGAADFNIRVFNMETKKLVHTFEGAHKDWVMGLSVSSDSRFLVSSSADNSLIKWDLEKMERSLTLEQAHQGKSFLL